MGRLNMWLHVPRRGEKFIIIFIVRVDSMSQAYENRKVIQKSYCSSKTNSSTDIYYLCVYLKWSTFSFRCCFVLTTKILLNMGCRVHNSYPKQVHANFQFFYEKENSFLECKKN